MQAISSLLRNKNTTTIENASHKATSNSDFKPIFEQLLKPPALLKSNSKETPKIQPQTSLEKTPTRRIDEHLLSDLLHISESLKMKISLPLLSMSKATLGSEKFENSPKALQELSHVKNINELVALAKKYDLGLEKLTITPVLLENLEKSFPLLAQSNFFKSATHQITDVSTQTAESQHIKRQKEPIFTLEAPLTKVKTSTKDSVFTQNADTKIILSKLIVEDKNENAKTTSKLSSSTTLVNEPLHETTLLHKNPLEIFLQQSKIEQQPLSTFSTLTLPLVQEKPDNRALTHDDTENKNLDNSFPKLSPIVLTTKNEIQNKTTSIPKESLTHFANDLKEVIEAYKPPIMKVELALNPKNLGEVEITLLTRGNNLCVSIAANPSTSALFAQYQTEFKNALNMVGFASLEMNFGHQKNQNNTPQNDKKSSYKTSASSSIEETFESKIMQSMIAHYI